MGLKRAKAQIGAPSDADTITQAQEFYGVEGHGVDSESDGDSEPNEGDDSEEGFLGIEVLKREYNNKKDIIDSVADYHARVMRPYKVSKSDKRRYKVTCPVMGCDFLAQFAFTSSFGRVPKLVPHSCEADYSNQVKKRFNTAKYLVRNVRLREHFLQFEQKNITPAITQRKANKLGLHASYMNCANAFKHLMREFYGDDYSQYPCIPSYVGALEKNGHKACCEIVAETFSRLAIVYREGIQAFSQYADRGLSIDGTFLETLVGGTLLVACFRNGNMELQI
uniref:Transposase MuDR plant domain-containing protein n=1 Tax=Globisporangium ultimum (strain ATCC 200006 / CBS 805.95 / DAOM BR144) TaxID=431595 RepID=K3WRF0_GLOUD